MARREGESIHRRVSVRMHGDEKVRKLSRPTPSGKGLWYELLIGEQTGIIPGLFKIGEAAFAEQLDWPLEGFRKAFAEVSGQGMVRSDWKARLTWVPNALRHNFPQSPNVIIHWRDAWDMLPECHLKLEAWHHLRALLDEQGEAWSKAFEKACPKPTSNQGTGNREQGEEEKKPLAAVASPTDKQGASPEQASCRKAIRERFLSEYGKRSGGAEFRWGAPENTAIKTLAALDGAGGTDPAKGLRALEAFIERMPVKRYYAENFAPRIVVQELNNLRLAVVADGPRSRGPGAAGASRPVASAADFERDAVEHEQRLREASK